MSFGFGFGFRAGRIRGRGAAGTSLTAPTLTWTSAETVDPPEFEIDLTNPQEGDIVRLYKDGVLAGSHTLTAGELSSLTFDLGLTAWGNGTYSATAKHERGGVQSAASDPVSVTIAAVSLTLDFTTGSYTGATPTATRAQTVTSYAEYLDGTLASFAADTLRRTDKGLLVEPAATSLVPGANLSDWTASGVTLTANDAAAPDGTVTATLATASASGHVVLYAFAVSESTQYTFSLWAKRGTMTDMKLSVYDLSNNAEVIAPTSYYSEVDAGGGWSLVERTFTTPAGCSAVNIYPLRDSGSTGTCHLWAPEAEAGAVASSPIVATTAPVTRNADDIAFTIPAGVTTLTYTFDDDSTQTASVSAGSYTIPTNLNRRYIKSVVGS